MYVGILLDNVFYHSFPHCQHYSYDYENKLKKEGQNIYHSCTLHKNKKKKNEIPENVDESFTA